MAEDKPSKDHQIESHLKDQDYEKIGRALETIVISGYHSVKRLFFFNFVRGIFFGLGSAVGATVLLVLLIWALNLFSEVPLIGELFENAQNTVERVQNGTP